MAKAKKAKRLPYKAMPPTKIIRSGCKVGWYYYADEAIAKKAAAIALHNSRIDESLGYDFGYCSPGNIRHMPDTEEAGQYRNLFEVCVS